MKRTLVIALVAATAVAATSFAYAAIPSANGVISACKDTGGAIKLIDKEAGQSCPNKHTLVEWNQQGPVGATGPAGPSDGYVEMVSASIIPGTAESKTVATLSLPAGKYILFAKGYFLASNTSGGCTLSTPQASDTAIAYQPTAAAAFENFALIAPAVYATPGEATLSCMSYGGLEVSDVKLTAIKVANLTAPL